MIRWHRSLNSACQTCRVFCRMSSGFVNWLICKELIASGRHQLAGILARSRLGLKHVCVCSRPIVARVSQLTNRMRTRTRTRTRRDAMCELHVWGWALSFAVLCGEPICASVGLSVVVVVPRRACRAQAELALGGLDAHAELRGATCSCSCAPLRRALMDGSARERSAGLFPLPTRCPLSLRLRMWMSSGKSGWMLMSDEDIFHTTRRRERRGNGMERCGLAGGRRGASWSAPFPL